MGVGPLEAAIFTVARVVQEKYNDVELSEKIFQIASQCSSAGMDGADGWLEDHPANIKITEINKTLIKDYLDN
tara:strand:- start:578 stop:796 length:219 start_codon:yes stop_codon:yes gene_type:complete